CRSLREPAVKRRQELTRRLAPTLCMPQPSEASGTAQLPGQRSLPARPLQRALKVLLGRRGGDRAPRQHDKLGLDALELRDGPMLLAGSGERLVDRRESLGDLPDPG